MFSLLNYQIPLHFMLFEPVAVISNILLPKHSLIHFFIEDFALEPYRLKTKCVDER